MSGFAVEVLGEDWREVAVYSSRERAEAAAREFAMRGGEWKSRVVEVGAGAGQVEGGAGMEGVLRLLAFEHAPDGASLVEVHVSRGMGGADPFCVVKALNVDGFVSETGADVSEVADRVWRRLAAMRGQRP